ncbi:unnamed protein product [Mytilus coruscus]|uniref:Uncharacterized protein n=1 Tax=Mytilus coruscus TaxID=42192 RepID=A0A6J7ZYP2_MYTCO|nr:unnamed protein product [Mytilus coruscus]
MENTEKRLIRSPEIASAYTETIDKYIEKGYVRKVTNDDNKTTRKWYLPHFPVVRPDKDTTKTRVVFDASAKYDGISLNNIIHKAPKLQRDLFDVLLRFRKYPVALVCAEMYLMIKIPPKDRSFPMALLKDRIKKSREKSRYRRRRVAVRKTLGVLWLAEDDIFTFKANPPDEHFKFTKRKFLSKIAMLFDPLGFIAPYSIRAKIFMHEIWQAGLDWDDIFDDVLVNKPREWFNELNELCDIRIPKCLQLSERIKSSSLQMFANASEEAYGCVIYA